MDRLETKMNWGTPIPLYALPESVHPGRPYFHPRLETWEENGPSSNAILSFLKPGVSHLKSGGLEACSSGIWSHFIA